MPITANWIWPRYGTPFVIIFLIVSMFLSLSLGIFTIKLFYYFNKQTKGKENNKDKEERLLTNLLVNEEEKTNDYTSCNSLKYLHGFFMIYAWVMLLGAGQAFLSY